MRSNLVEADLARPDDVDKILELNVQQYGTDDVLVTWADFTWRCTQNPAGAAIIPVIRDTQDNIVGFIFVVPLFLRVKGRHCLAATGTNLVIHPEYRNTFSYTKLLRRFFQVFRDNAIPLHFSFVSEAAYWREQARIPHTVLTVPLMVKVINFKSLAQDYFSGKWQSQGAGWIGRIVSPFFFPHLSIPTSDIKIQVVEQFDLRFDEFWLRVRDKYPVMVIRDQAFLAWRFASISTRHYHILVAQTQDQMLGYIVLRCLTIRGIRTGLIMDFLVVDGVLGQIAATHLIAEAEAYFLAQQMSVVTCLMTPWASEYRFLHGAGYQSLPQFIAPRLFRFAFYVHTPNQDLVSLSASEWFVTIADYEAF